MSFLKGLLPLSFLKGLLPLPFLILAAYLGGLFFGQNPQYLRSLWGSKVVLGISKDTKFLSGVATEWLKSHSGHEIEVRILEDPSKVALFGIDLLFLSSDEVKEFFSEFTPPSPDLRALPDSTLLRNQDRALPILWKLVPGKLGTYELKRWMLADVSGKPANVNVLYSAMSPEFHALLIRENVGFHSSRPLPALVKEFQILHETPLQQIEF